MDNKIISELQDMRYLSWSRIRNSSGTAGSFLKAYDDFGTRKRYYKLSNYNPGIGIVGHECVNEIIVDRLLTILGIPHLEYKLIHAQIELDNKEYETYLCMSYDFKNSGESKIALETFYELEKHHNTESMLEFCINNGWGNYIYQMLVVDFLILNRDRHGANIEVLRNSREKTIRLAPLFDHGLSLVCTCATERELNNFDILKGRRVQCCVGSFSSLENLKLIPQNQRPKLNPLKQSDKEKVMCDLAGILSNKYRNKIWEMLLKRWKIYEDICNQK